eukprot:CAMPEP_0175072420 /NCGR_PEP_ID=MMETSP0052_2-20121109/19899_1 /TAXON_ID=51329 ORGANISM="Polytomella parva, Strain SAG 63-3" /NCGR_SAMPLE_ID=MMETSP0052_2 /ASSEMBLY_ACC=CAM_ASM_000194 /LENGTH=364 /DNA_ID=CAMNT_0016339921 /DNA_START=93 /DNA_END=1184 /DNA_ORIENTATION=-
MPSNQVSTGSSMDTTSNDKKLSNHMSRRFEAALIAIGESSGNRARVEAAHLQGYYARGLHNAEKAQMDLLSAQQSLQDAHKNFRKERLDQMSANRNLKSLQKSEDLVEHHTLMRQKDELTRVALRNELAISETKRLRRELDRRQAATDLNSGVDNFELNLRRLVRPGDKAKEGEMGGGEDTPPMPAGRTPLEHMDLMKSRAPANANLLAMSQPYLKSIHAARIEELDARREREARRTKVIVEQQKGLKDAEEKSAAAALVERLAKEGEMERRQAAELWRREGDEKRVDEEERLAREKEYQIVRAREWDDSIRRDAERLLATKDERMAAAALAAAENAKRKAALKREKSRLFAEKVVVQLIQIAE